MSAERQDIQAAIASLITSRLPKGVGAVNVEPAENEEGDEYLLVTVQLASADINDEALEKLLEEIEAEVANLDDRYPSVRFLDAA